jgi:hypothetical protein
VAWEINPDAAMMGGTRALIAFKHSNGTVLVQTYNVTDANKGAPLEPSKIDFTVEDTAVEFKNNQITIFATWKLKNNKTTVNHVWNTGGAVKGLVPQAHAFASANLASKGTIDLKSGVATTSTSTPHHALKNVSAMISISFFCWITSLFSSILMQRWFIGQCTLILSPKIDGIIFGLDVMPWLVIVIYVI